MESDTKKVERLDDTIEFWIRSKYLFAATGFVFMMFYFINMTIHVDKVLANWMLSLECASFSGAWFSMGMWRIRLKQIKKLTKQLEELEKQEPKE
jgi:hypothetical protein